MQKEAIPVITIDGPSASGKGTVSRLLAKELSWNFLDSGLIYRALAIAVLNADLSLEQGEDIASIAKSLDLSFNTKSDFSLEMMLDNADVTKQARTPECGNIASKISVFPQVRSALLAKQRAFKQQPGLVADGRDMGSVVFPEAKLKFFLDAKAKIRAKRRAKQLNQMGVDVSIERVESDILERDARDFGRKNSPLTKSDDVIYIDTSEMDPRQVVSKVLVEVEANYAKIAVQQNK